MAMWMLEIEEFAGRSLRSGPRASRSNRLVSLAAAAFGLGWVIHVQRRHRVFRILQVWNQVIRIAAGEALEAWDT